MTLLLALHLFGFVAWLGGGLASMVIGIAGRSGDAAALGVTARLQWAVTRLMVLPGALLTVFSGLMLTFRLMHGSAMGNPWMASMQGAGLVGALVALFVAVPAAARLARLDPVGAEAARVRVTSRVAASISGALGLFALLAAVLYRTGA